MRVQRVRDVASWLDPQAEGWARIGAERIALMPAPLGLQPTAYLRAAFQERPYGQTASLEAAAVHDGERIVFGLTWRDASEDRGGAEAFADAAAIALPVAGEPPLATMGAADAPIHLLHWRASEERPRSVLAAGLGSTRPGPDHPRECRALWKDGAWQVVIARSLAGGEGGAPLAPGARSLVAFAVWDGGNRERAGIKAVSLPWRELLLDA
jgi:DMSO reductase family type II enzyme heme b subunit